MQSDDNHFERLINRRLDGELSADESLQLDKCLIRDPSTRQCLEESQRIDELSATVVNEICNDGGDYTSVAVKAARPRGRLRWIGVFPAVAAACLALIFVWPTSSPTNPAHDVADDVERTPIVAQGPILPLPRRSFATNAEAPNGLKPLREMGTRLDYYGVLDEKTNELYLLEVRHHTTAQRRNQANRPGFARSGARLASGEM